ncbi:MAG: glycosyltransferase family 2 protein [Acidobacteria bacterium]|nr:glycosyltransferase family 2 protein [Acidobacteriota bacterium]
MTTAASPSGSRPLTFSVCIPNYNYERYLGQTIDSVLAQTYPHFEIVVADNASTDGSVAAVRGYDDPRIRLIENRYNIGFSPNLDRATESATGDFLILLSSDDLMRPDALETYARVLEGLGERSEDAVLTSALDVIDSAGEVTGVSWRPPGELFYQELDPAAADRVPWDDLDVESHAGDVALAAALRAKNTPAAFLATCYSRSLYQRVEGYHNPYRIWPDSHFLNKLLSAGAELHYVPRRLFAYRVHNHNQLAQEAKAGALTYQVDAYMHTVEFPGAVLERIGVERRELEQVFIEKAVMERGLQALAAGNGSRGFRCLAFGFGTYPGLAFTEPKTWALAGLVLLGPVGKGLARWLYRRRQERRLRADAG